FSRPVPLAQAGGAGREKNAASQTPRIELTTQCHSSTGKHAGFVVDLAAPPQVVDRAADLGGEMGQGSGLAMLLRAAGEPLLAALAVADEQAGGFAEGPFQVGVADLGVRRAPCPAGPLL